VYRLFVPTVPEALPRGLLAVLRHPDPIGAEVSMETAAWALKPLALSPYQRALVAQARVLVLVTAGGSEPPPEAEAAATLPGAEAGSLPAAAVPPSPAAVPQWPEWLPG
jgi:hypothetical protein